MAEKTLSEAELALIGHLIGDGCTLPRHAIQYTTREEDLAQEVFVRALTHRPEKPRAWVFAVAANLARDEARAAVRRKRHLTLLKGDPAIPTLFP